MEVFIHVAERRVTEKSSGHVFAAWTSHSFEEPQLHGKGDPASRFQAEMSVECHRVNAPIGGTLEPAETKDAVGLMLRVSPKLTLNAAEVLTLAERGERGFRLLPLEVAQSAPSRDHAA